MDSPLRAIFHDEFVWPIKIKALLLEPIYPFCLGPIARVYLIALGKYDRHEWDAARGLGMRRPLMLRIVILPQALRIALLPFLNTCMVLIKSTSLVSIIGLRELTR